VGLLLTCYGERDTIKRSPPLLNTQRMPFIVDNTDPETAHRLLAPGEPATFSVLNYQLLSDPLFPMYGHASARIPRNPQQLRVAAVAVVRFLARKTAADL